MGDQYILDLYIGRVIETPDGLAELLTYRLDASGAGYVTVRFPDDDPASYPVQSISFHLPGMQGVLDQAFRQVRDRRALELQLEHLGMGKGV